MSKLYNTLEQIRRQESFQVAAAGRTTTAGGKPWQDRGKIFGGLAVVAGVTVLLYLSYPLLVSRMAAGPEPARTSAPSAPAVNSATSPVAGAAARPTAAGPARGQGAGSTPQDFISLNNQGAECIRKLDYWQGLSFLAKARKIDPRRVEPLINTAVALAELGFNELALHYFKQVAALEPNHPLLQANLEILAKAGVGN